MHQEGMQLVRRVFRAYNDVFLRNDPAARSRE
jgi:hypothetical protein